MSKIVPIRPVASEPDVLSALFRLTSCRRVPLSDGRIRWDAAIYHHPHRYETHWDGSADDMLSPGQLVRIEWGEWPLNPDGSLTVAKLVHAALPERDCNLFLTAPNEWIGNQATRHEAAQLWNALSPNFRFLFNAVFWDAARFQTYLMRQSTQSSRHLDRHGALARALELTALARQLPWMQNDIDRSILVFAGLLRDVETYDAPYHDGDRCGNATVPAAHTVNGWIDDALTRHAITIPERTLGILQDAMSVMAKRPPCIVFSEHCPLEAKILLAVESLEGAFDAS